MRFSATLIPTLRESPADAEIASHRLLLRAGMMRQVASGIYNFLPLGLISLEKVSRIIRDEMNRAGAQEILMSVLQPRELWEESGRWEKYGPEMMRMQDRAGRDFGLGPTHEEMITDLVRQNVTSYRQLPLNLYQIAVKFRDEVRPRFGLLRGREFIMKDGYSFDRDEEAMRHSYQRMYESYSRIVERCGCEFMVVEADTGLIGGDVSHEFSVPAAVGEDKIAFCRACGYAANVERAEYGRRPLASGHDEPPEMVQTPGKRSVEEVGAFLSVPAERVVKCMIYLVEDRPVAVLVTGDREVNETKLAKVLGTDKFRLFEEKDWAAYPDYISGYVGPAGLKGVQIIGDLQLEGARDMVCGANRKDFHLVHVAYGNDFQVDRMADVSSAREGDACPRCGQPMSVVAGIEVAQIFQLRTKYSEPMHALYVDEHGQKHPFMMGTYGIGVSRLLAAVAEQHHDQRGLIWPVAVAPAHLHVIPLNMAEGAVRDAAERLYQTAGEWGLEVLIDDRDESAGVKFADADLLGIPFRAVLGKKFLAEGLVELQSRSGGEKEMLPAAGVPARVKGLLAQDSPSVTSTAGESPVWE